MTPRKKLLVIIGLAVAADLLVRVIPNGRAPRAEDVRVVSERAAPIDLAKPFELGDYAFLDSAVGSASIVQLGESIHLTSELPLARIALVKYLHERMGFDLIALEGSLTQAWVAQEHLYRARDGRDTVVDGAQRMAWFGIWNTPEMRTLMAYVAETQRTARPLYLASFDVQTGSAREFAWGMGRDIARVFGEMLVSFAPVPPRITAIPRPWMVDLGPVLHCGMNNPAGLGSARTAALAAIDTLQVWIDAIAPDVARARPPAHAAALRRIPDNLRDHAYLCDHSMAWQATRDTLNADNAVALRDSVSTSHRVMLWAHHSHVGHNSEGWRIPSMGEHLHKRLGPELYTIGTFAGGGSAATFPFFVTQRLPSTNKLGVERMLAAVDKPAYFLDVSRLPADTSAAWLNPRWSRMEGFWDQRTILAKDFDGLVYVDRVHPVSGMLVGRALWLSRAGGIVVGHPAATIVLVLGFALWALTAIVSALQRVVARYRRRTVSGSRSIA